MRKKLEKINIILRWFLEKVRRIKYKREIALIKKKKPELFKKIDSALEKKHKKYWSVLVANVNLSWLRFCFNISGKGDFKIIPPDIYYAIVERILNNANYSEYESDKNYYERFLRKDLFPFSFLRRNLGEYLDGDYNFVSSKEAQNIFDNIREDFVIKPTIDTHSGQNVKILKYENEEFYYEDNKEKRKITWEEVNEKWGNDYVVQKVVRSHDFFSKFNPSSLNTLRIHTYRSVKDNRIIPLYVVLRMGRSGRVVDNIDSGGILCLVDESGNLNDYALSYYGDKFFEHPDSKVKFKDLKIPFLKEALKEAEAIALKMPAQRLIGMDIAICPDGKIKVIELNILGVGTYLVQIYGRSLFGEYSDEVLEYCLANKHKDNFKILRI